MKPQPEWGDMIVVPQSAARGTPLRDLLTHAFRDRYRIALAFAIGMVLTVVASMLPSKKYTSEAALLLRLGRENI